MNLRSVISGARAALVALAFIGLAGSLAGCNDDSSSNSNAPAQSTSAPTQAAPAPAAPAQTAQAPQAKAATPSQPAAATVSDAEASLDLNVYFVFDGSGSMNNCPPIPPSDQERNFDGRCTRKIKAAKEAVSAVVKTLPPNTNLGLYVFDNNGRSERVKLAGNNQVEFLKAVDRIVAGDGTPLGAGMEKGAKALGVQFEKQLHYGEYRLVVVTDGMPDTPTEVPHALTQIRKSGVPISIYTVGFGMNDPNHPLRKASATFWAAYTGEAVKDALQQSLSESQSFDPTEFQSK
jgi:hypothetical protein